MITVEGKNPEMIANNMASYYKTHPGEVLKDEVEFRGISQKTLAAKIGMSYKVLNDILNEHRPVTTESAMLFEAALGISAHTLLALQAEYNISEMKKNSLFQRRLKSIRKMASIL